MQLSRAARRWIFFLCGLFSFSFLLLWWKAGRKRGEEGETTSTTTAPLTRTIPDRILESEDFGSFQKARRSDLRCVPTDDGFVTNEDRDPHTACQFWNVCWSRDQVRENRPTLDFFIPESNSDLMPIVGFHTDKGPVGAAMLNNSAFAGIRGKDMDWHLMVQMSHDAVPSQTDETVRWIEETVAFFLPISIEADSMNIGHVVHEDIVPLMHLANLFGVALESVRVLWHSSLARWAGDLEKLRGEVERIIRDFYAALVRIPPEFLEDFWRQEQSISPSLNRLCFRHLIAGASWMKSIHGVGDYRFLSPLLREVRMKVYNHHGLQNLGRMDIPPVPFRDQRKVLVIRKSGGMRTRSMQNIDEVAEWTREILNERVVRESGYSATVSVFDWKSVRAGGLKEELGVWSSVDILITPCGGVSMLGFFMRPGAQMIVMDHLEDDSRYAKSMSMEKMIWEALPWMSVQFYQIINRTDLVLPPEAWEDVDKHPERAHPVFRNEANVMVQKGRLRLLVLNAVERLRTFETRLLE